MLFAYNCDVNKKIKFANKQIFVPVTGALQNKLKSYATNTTNKYVGLYKLKGDQTSIAFLIKTINGIYGELIY